MILPCVDGNTAFPEVKQALREPDGLLCFGGDLSCQRLIAAYQQGIFPWYSVGEPILWWSPSKRMVLFPDQFKTSKSLQKAIRKHQPKFYLNRHFSTVINNCAHIPRKDRGTWIHAEMIAAYEALFHAGHAFCLEVEIDGKLVGGIYGVKTGPVFCGESMFSLQTNGSKYAMFGLCQIMEKENIKLLDCQIHNPHLAFMGAGLISRRAFKSFLSEAD